MLHTASSRVKRSAVCALSPTVLMQNLKNSPASGLADLSFLPDTAVILSFFLYFSDNAQIRSVE